MRNFILQSVVGLFFFIAPAKSQSIDTLLVRYFEKRPAEKIYVQFDNNQYQPGQTIWYKVYLLNGFVPSEISKNCYLDWYNEDGKLISSSVSPIVNGSAWGTFVLPETVSGNSLHVIAYTRWMLNSDSNFFFKKQLGLVTKNKSVTKIVNAFPETTIQFLPESGNALVHKTSVIAFKAINQNGLPEKVQGIIKKSKGDIVANFNSVHDGMGKFKYIPEPNETYTAEWTDEINKTYHTILPAALTKGISLNIEIGKDSRNYQIQRTPDVPEAWKRLSIVAEMNGHIMYKASINLSAKESINSKLPIENFLSGILHITLFDANQEPVCERLILVNNNDFALDAELHFDTLSLDKRGKNIFELEIKDTTLANLSISVTDGGLNSNTDNSIISQFLLKGDLSGYIHNPAYYFSSSSDSLLEYVDLVMLTNGWRRYKWHEILSNSLPPLRFERDSSFLSIIGNIERISDAKITKAATINLILLSKDSSKSMFFVPLKTDGSFSEKNVFFFDTTKIFYNLNNTKIPNSSNVSIENNFFKPDNTKILKTSKISIDTSGYSRYQYFLSEENRLADLKKQTTLKDVTVFASSKKSKLEQLDQKYASGMFQGSARAQFDFINSPPNSSEPILAYLQGRVAGLTISNPYGNATVNWRGSATTIYLNEFRVDLEQLSGVSINDIAYLKVFSPPFMGGFGGSGGAIVVYTKKGNDLTYTSKGMSFIKVAGYAPMQEFYAPNYAELQQTYTTPDLRTTIYWNPSLITDSSNQKLKFSFFNNDYSHSFRVVLEGMDSDGKLVHISKLLQ